VRVVVLIPWRGGDELREQSWDVVRPHLERLGWDLYAGDAEGEWSRGAAINAMALQAGSWDVAVIGDADTVPERSALMKAISQVRRTGGGCRPHDQLFRLTPSGSIAFAQGKALEERHIDKLHPGGGYLVVARDGWDRVGGYDESFVGWGHEDTAFNVMLLAKADWDRTAGRAWHLFHPEVVPRTREYRMNRNRMAQILKEHRSAILAAEKAKGWKLGAVL
jgi:hypothetical protein